MYRAIIIDDENKAIKSLNLIIDKYCEKVEIIGTANTALEGIKLINQLNPDIVFLDIEMPHGNGFDVLEAIPKRNFEVVFVTAYNQHAIKAFKFSAFDYILKPIEIDEIISTIDRIDKKIKEKRLSNYNVLFENIRAETIKKLSLPTVDGIDFINVKEIYYIESDRNYSNIYNEKSEKLLVTKTLSDIEDLLTDSNFFRCHKSFLVNLFFVKRYVKGDGGGKVELKNGTELPVSRRKKESLLKLLTDK